MDQTSAAAGPQSGRDALLLRFFSGAPLQGREQSFKLSRGSLLANRCLIGIARDCIPEERLFGLCRQMEMPQEYLLDLGEQLAGADVLHFGYEEGEASFIYKVYLEYADRYYRALADDERAALEAGRDGRVLVHLAYKWDVLDPRRRAIATYHCLPALGIDAMLERVAALCAGDGPGLDAVKNVVALAASRSAGTPMYLEVREQGNPRASFDINLHDAGLCLGEIEAPLLRLARHHAIPAEQTQRLFERVRADKLGHVSGGTSRDGEDFFTVYHESVGPVGA